MPKITKAERIALHREWEKRISEFRASSQTRKAWCECNHVSIRQFHYWFGKFSHQEPKNLSQPGSWTQVQIKETVQTGRPSTQSALSVRIGPAIIEIRDDYNPSLLLDVVKVLQELC